MFIKKDLILIGKQGSGKGTQAKYLVEEFGFEYFETGGALRKMAEQDSELGRKVKDITTRGDLVPNEIVMEIVGAFLKEIPNGTPVLFDGIPRSELQRETLEALLKKAQRDFIALEIRLSEESALNRLLIRGKCNKCGTNFGGEICPSCGSTDVTRRADDNEAAIRRRLENFDVHTAPLLEKWKEWGKLISVDGEGNVKEVWEEILKVLKTN